MGSKSSSKTDNYTEETNIVPTNNSTGDGDTLNATGTGGSTVNLSTTDHGAVSAGRDLAIEALQFSEGVSSNTFDILDRTFGTAFGVVRDANLKTVEVLAASSSSALDAVERATQSEASEQGRMVFIGGAVLVAIVGVVMVARALK